MKFEGHQNARRVGEYVRSLPNSESRLGLLRFAQFGFGAILGKEFPDIPAHDLVTGRAQMNMIIYKQVSRTGLWSCPSMSSKTSI